MLFYDSVILWLWVLGKCSTCWLHFVEGHCLQKWNIYFPHQCFGAFVHKLTCKFSSSFVIIFVYSVTSSPHCCQIKCVWTSTGMMSFPCKLCRCSLPPELSLENLTVIAEKDICGALIKYSCWLYLNLFLNGVSAYFFSLDSDLCKAFDVEVPLCIWMDCDVEGYSNPEYTLFSFSFLFFSKRCVVAMPPLQHLGLGAVI